MSNDLRGKSDSQINEPKEAARQLTVKELEAVSGGLSGPFPTTLPKPPCTCD